MTSYPEANIICRDSPKECNVMPPYIITCDDVTESNEMIFWKVSGWLCIHTYTCCLYGMCMYILAENRGVRVGSGGPATARSI